MRNDVPLKAPSHLKLLRHAIDYWEYRRWDERWIDWYAIREKPHALRMALVDGTLEASLLTVQGTLHSVPASQWSNGRLWGEAYEASLTTVLLQQHRVNGYLYVDRKRVEALRDADDSQPDVPPDEVIGIVEREAPPIGLILRALCGDVGRSRAGVVDSWLRDAWPDALNDVWPRRLDRDALNSPSMARDINYIIRTMPQVPLVWSGERPADPKMSELATRYPLIAASVEVFRLCRDGDLDDFGDKVTASKARDELGKRVPIPPGSTLAAELFRRLAKIAIPDEKVTGGGRRTRRV
jgi:hypothetical protein